jgi:anti-sigma regulatory factor (Ser/Thr protein kinase)
MNTPRRTTALEGTVSERFRSHRGPPKAHWSARIETPDHLKSTRDQARTFLIRNAVPPRNVDDIVLTLSELLSNALTSQETSGAVTAELDFERPRLITLLVTNERSTSHSSSFPSSPIEMPRPDVPRGRGLPLVAALASRVSIDQRLGSTQVRADFFC